MSKIEFSSTKDKFTYFNRISTRWRDLDSRQHINHATYLTYLETSRFEFAKKLFRSEIDFIMASMTIDYHKQLSHPEDLEIGQKVVEVGNKSLKILSAIFRNGEKTPVVTALATLVSFNYNMQETCPVPNIVKKFLDK